MAYQLTLTKNAQTVLLPSFQTEMSRVEDGIFAIQYSNAIECGALIQFTDEDILVILEPDEDALAGKNLFQEESHDAASKTGHLNTSLVFERKLLEKIPSSLSEAELALELSQFNMDPTTLCRLILMSGVDGDTFLAFARDNPSDLYHIYRMAEDCMDGIREFICQKL